MTIRLILLCAICLLTAIFTMAGENGVSTHGALRVAGTRLVNARGEPVQLRGMSSHGLQWYPEYINAGALRDLKQRGANLFRLAMYADSNNGGYNDAPLDKLRNQKLLRLGVENALAADMYVIVDWHLLEDQNPLKTVESAEEFFADISRLYAQHPAVIYEICNEPNGDTAWSDIAAYADRIIPIIRNNAPNAVIIVGTPHYSSRILDVLPAPLSHENVMYAFHYYTGFSDLPPGGLLDEAAQAGLPIFVSEWGLSGGEPADAEKAIAFIDYMRRNAVSWANWSLCNKDEEFSAIRHDVDKLSGWTMDDLTVSGRIIFSALAESGE